MQLLLKQKRAVGQTPGGFLRVLKTLVFDKILIDNILSIW